MKSKLNICISSVLLSLGTNFIFLSSDYLDRIFDPDREQSENLCTDPISIQDGWEVFGRNGIPFGIFSIPRNFADLGETSLKLSKHISIHDIPNCKIALKLGKISEKANVYWNGDLLIERHGDNIHDPEPYDKTRIYDQIPIQTENTLEIFIFSYFVNELGILEGNPSIGNSDLIYKTHFRSQILYLILISLFSFLGAYLLFLTIQERKLESHFYFGNFLILFFLYSFFKAEWKYELGWDFLLSKKVEYISLALLFPSFTAYFSNFCRGRNSNLEFPLALWSGFVSFLFLYCSDPLELDTLNRYLLQPSWILYIVILLVSLKTRIEHPDGYGFLGAILLFLISILMDVFSARGFILIPKTSGYSLLGFILFCSFRISGRFVEMKNELKLWNDNLQKEVLSRTEELRNSLDRIQTLKLKQDGDYFLMSVLQNSFQNKIGSFGPFRIEVFVKQYKSFEFKGKQLEIGGDTVCMEEIKLQGKKYLAVLNVDAMGKSLQGATGALLSSSMFRSHIESSSTGYYTPETWIVALYEKIQSLFESFDGNLFATGILSLMDPENSTIFFLNAQHPSSILVRNRISGYVENETSYKMGIPFEREIPKVYSISLLEEDVLIFGSDGREDLRTRTPSREIESFSENFLLEAIHTNSPISDLTDRMKGYGDYTDDVSLVRIHRIRENEKRSRDLWRETSKRKNLQKGILLWKQNEKRAAIGVFSKLSMEDPRDLDIAYISAWAFWKIGDLEKAKAYSEKLLYRDPKNHQNLVLLAKIYFKLGISSDIIQSLLEGSGLDVQRMFSPTDNFRKVS
ncbi:SpoIIE family protein phosphatase [Leptospira sarikeiensis]|uniref:PPM-type phosphatase domain-containing protein n=1 Tax=Leptospira sarikeiensis TaxID=2484943 RepID=A0A4R9K1F3_9LEPT|nr:SpoIIE family protein phosphatase [Leptospira sarikeiensis]TGL59532.1 hypothetical protein EHQ64_15685 [Leptospira sarikeiensis]